MTNADLFWNLLQMYLAEKEKNSKKEENTNDENGECKKLHSQKNLKSRGCSPYFFNSFF